MLELSNDPSSAVTVWAVLSSFVQVTLDPAATESDAGPNAKFLIVTASPPPAAGASLGAAALGAAAEAATDAAGVEPDPPHAASAAAQTSRPTSRMGRGAPMDDICLCLLAPAWADRIWARIRAQPGRGLTAVAIDRTLGDEGE